jgi:hypothetical protein
VDTLTAKPRERDTQHPSEADVFSGTERKLVFAALNEAEEHTSNYYCIPPRHWLRLPYDLITRKDHEWMPVPEAVLARLQRLERVSVRRPALDFYRIQLNDPSILGAARRNGLESEIYPFLVYILTHEMVHLVRLGTMIDNEVDLVPSFDVEEKRVDRISRQILARTHSERFRPVLDKFPCRLSPTESHCGFRTE